MAEDFLTFQKFNDMGLAEAVSKTLGRSGIEFRLENNQKFFDPSFANNDVQADISLKIRAEDFPKADQALAEYYRQQLDTVEADYYLFEFTDRELLEIVSKPDEWGHFDYQLAQKILKERGIEISPEAASRLKEKRVEELAKPEPVHSSWIYIGYIATLFGGAFGIIIGAILAYFKKTLPDGRRVYVYPEVERKHGKWILGLSIISTVIWIVLGKPLMFLWYI